MLTKEMSKKKYYDIILFLLITRVWINWHTTTIFLYYVFDAYMLWNTFCMTCVIFEEEKILSHSGRVSSNGSNGEALISDGSNKGDFNFYSLPYFM